jgi:hypothetical protein
MQARKIYHNLLKSKLFINIMCAVGSVRKERGKVVISEEMICIVIMISLLY